MFYMNDKVKVGIKRKRKWNWDGVREVK